MYITSFIHCIIDNLAISFYFSLSLNCKIELLNQQIYFSYLFIPTIIFYNIHSLLHHHIRSIKYFLQRFHRQK